MQNLTRKRFLQSVLTASGLSLTKPLDASTGLTGSYSPSFNLGLGGLPMLTPRESRQISPENPTGEKGMGARAVPSPSLPFSAAAAHLGQGWKVSPFVKPKAGETLTIMDTDGPGFVEHIWMASQTTFVGNGRACVLRFYWDHEPRHLLRFQ
jgi:hypothetical protein